MRNVPFALAALLAVVVSFPVGADEVTQPFDPSLPPPHLEVRREVSPGQIWYRGGGTPDEAEVRVTVAGAGGPAYTHRTQDTVFVMDRSGSMELSDPGFMRVTAAQRYVDRMFYPDRGAVVSFADNATLVGGHLHGNFPALKEALATVRYASGTNFEAALSAAADEFTAYGNRSRPWVEILLTDGIPDPREANVTAATIERTARANISVYTIGLGINLDENLLMWISASTGGKYFHAESPEQLAGIYENLSSGYMNYTAGTDTTLTDVLPPGVHYVPGSASPPPATVLPAPNGTTLSWSVPLLNLSRSWNATYRIQVERPGNRNTTVAELSGARYRRWDSSFTVAPMPQATVGVSGPLPPPPPPLMPPAPPPPPVPPPPPPMMPVYTPPTVMVQPQVFVQAQPAPLQLLFAPFIGIGLGKVSRKLKGTPMKGIGVFSPSERRKVRERVKERDRREKW